MTWRRSRYSWNRLRFPSEGDEVLRAEAEDRVKDANSRAEGTLEELKAIRGGWDEGDG